MPTGLNVADVVNVTLTLSPLAAGYRNFGATLIIGSSEVIDVNERVRVFTQIEEVATTFGVNAPEYKAATLFFSQSPQPNLLYIGRWAQGATRGLLHGAVLTPTQQLLGGFTNVANGSLTISIDGVAKTLSGVNLSSATNLNGVASLLQAALTSAGATGAQIVWDSNLSRFTVYSGTTGTASSVSYAQTSGAGTDLAPLFGFLAPAASVPVNGVAAESLIQGVTTLADVSADWYAAIVATTVAPSNSDHLAVAAYIEAASLRRLYGITITTTDVLDPTRSDDLASQLKGLGYERTFTQYSSSHPYAVASLMARAATIDFEGNNTTLTIKFKQEPGIVAERLSESQAAALLAKNCNVFVYYQNGTAIIQEGVMANGYFFDEVQGTDWLVNAIQVDVFNLFLQQTTKIPQTDPGMNLIVNTINRTLARSVNNGLVAPGQWNAAGFGQLSQGDTLTNGFYVYCPPVASQPQALRERRITPPIQVAAKLAGAVHKTNIAISVNR